MMDSESALSWRDDTLGTRIRVALWLRDEVGEGQIFTKQHLRRDIDGVEQVDRRMRDLRPAGWVIRTYKDQPGLKANELYLERIGLPVWEPEHRSTGIRRTQDEIRRVALERDDFRCVLCGAVGGETYFDDPTRMVQLAAMRGPTEETQRSVGSEALTTICARCHAADTSDHDSVADAEEVWRVIHGLPVADRRLLLSWMENDRIASPTNIEIAWARFRRLSPLSRGILRRRLGSIES